MIVLIIEFKFDHLKIQSICWDSFIPSPVHQYMCIVFILNEHLVTYYEAYKNERLHLQQIKVSEFLNTGSSLVRKNLILNPKHITLWVCGQYVISHLNIITKVTFQGVLHSSRECQSPLLCAVSLKVIQKSCGFFFSLSLFLLSLMYQGSVGQGQVFTKDD